MGYIERPRVTIRTTLPNATDKIVYMTPDGSGNEFAQTGTATQDSGSATDVVEDSVLTFNANVVGAYVKMLSGLNKDLRRRILSRDSDHKITINPFPSNVVAADTFAVERDIQTVRKVRAWVEAGAHAHLSPFEPALAAYDNKIDDTLVWEMDVPEGTEKIHILTTSDVSSKYINIQAE